MVHLCTLTSRSVLSGTQQRVNIALSKNTLTNLLCGSDIKNSLLGRTPQNHRPGCSMSIALPTIVSMLSFLARLILAGFPVGPLGMLGMVTNASGIHFAWSFSVFWHHVRNSLIVIFCPSFTTPC